MQRADAEVEPVETHVDRDHQRQEAEPGGLHQSIPAVACVEVVVSSGSSGPREMMRSSSTRNRIPMKRYSPANPSSVKIPVPAGTDPAGEAPSLVRRSPYTSHG